MSNLNDKVISSNFQKLLQISHSTHAVLDGTGSAFGLRMSGSNIAINTAPADGIDLAVAGTISASIISASTGVFGADTVFIGGVQMSENSDGGITFQDSGSNELGAFAGPGFFVLTSSLEEHGSARPLFSLTQQVGSKLNENLAQINSQGVKIAQSFNANSAELKFGLQPSGSTQAGDFYISLETGIFTVNPSPGGKNEPSFYVTQSGRRIGMGMYPNNENMLTLGGGSGTGSNRGGGLFVSGSDVGHITASGNIQATSMSLGVGFPAPNTTLTVKGNISASGTVFADAFQSVTGGSTIDFNDSLDLTGNITASGGISSSGDISAQNLFVDSNIQHGGGDTDTKITFAPDTIAMIAGNTTFMTALETTQDVLTFGDGKDIDYRFRTSGSTTRATHNLFIQGDTNNIGIGTSTPTKELTVAGDISASGGVTASQLVANTAIKAPSIEALNTTSTIKDFKTISGSLGSTGSFGQLNIGTDKSSGVNAQADGKLTVGGRIEPSGSVNIGLSTKQFNIMHLKQLRVGLGTGTQQISASGFEVGADGKVHTNDLSVTGSIFGTGSFTATGDSKLGDRVSREHTITGSVEHTGSLTLNGDAVFNKNITVNGNIDGDGSTNITDMNQIEVGDKIIHDGDTNTHIAFLSDSIVFTAGDVQQLELLNKTGGGQDIITFNSGAKDVDFQVKTTGSSDSFFVQGSTGNVGINTSNPSYELEIVGDVSASGFVSASRVGATEVITNTIQNVEPGGSDTKIELDTDIITFTAGNEQLLQLSESTQDSVIVGDGGDVDFHVKATGSANAVNAIFVQGSTGRVGINSAAPKAELFVTGDISSSGTITANAGVFSSIDLSGASISAINITASGAGPAGGNMRADTIKVAEIEHASSSFKISGSTNHMHLIAGGHELIKLDGHGGNEVIINPDGLSGGSAVDFSVHSAFPLSHSLHVNGDSGKVGIGRGSLTGVDKKLVVSGSISASGDFFVEGNINASGNIIGDDGTNISNIGTIGCDKVFADSSTSTNMELTSSLIKFHAGNEELLRLTGSVSGTENEVIVGDPDGLSNSSTDFRVANKSGSHQFFVESTTSNIGFGGLPTNKITVYHSGSDADDGMIFVRDGDANVLSNEILGGIGFDSTDGNVPSAVTESSVYIAGYAAESQGTGDKGGYLVFGTSAENDDDDTAGNERMRIQEDGRIGIGTTSPTKTLQVAGDISSSGDVFIAGGGISGSTTLNLLASGRQLINMSQTNIVFNEGSNDVDVRMESNGNANGFHLDGNRDKVGIMHAPAASSATFQVTGDIKTNSNITASGNISSSGTISATGDLLISGDKVDFTALPTSSAGANTKGLFTQLGSALLGSGSAGSDERVKFNNFSASKFVLIKE